MPDRSARQLGYDTVCLTCEAPIHADERAFREHGVGAWHEDCYEPRNLKLYQRERDRGQHKRRTRVKSDGTYDFI